jgi:hypothetical protein
VINKSYLIFSLVILAVISGCMADTGDEQTENSEVKLQGVIVHTPYSLSNPAIDQHSVQPSAETHAAPVHITEVVTGPNNLENQTVITTYQSLPPTQNNSAPFVGDDIEISGYYDSSSHRINTSEPNEGKNIQIIGNSTDYPSPPVVGRTGETVRINSYDFTPDAATTDILTKNNAKIKLIDKNQARVTEGNVSYGESFSNPLNGKIVEITQHPNQK